MSKPLKVEPAALKQMGNTLATLAGENSQAESYVKEWVNPSGNAGGLILSKVTDALGDLQADLEKNYSRLGDITSGSSIQVSNAAYMYEATDYAWAAALDGTYVGGEK